MHISITEIHLAVRLKHCKSTTSIKYVYNEIKNRISEINFKIKWKIIKSLSRVWLFVTLWTVGWQAPMFIVFSRQEYWNELPFPFPNSAGQLQHTPWRSVYSLSHSNSAYSVFTWKPWAAQKSLSPDGEFVKCPWKEVRGWVQGLPHPSLPSSAQEPVQVSPASL